MKHPLPYAFARENLWLLEEEDGRLTLRGSSSAAEDEDAQTRRLSASVWTLWPA